MAGITRERKRSPRTWGWTAGAGLPAPALYAFPTHVGMDRYSHTPTRGAVCVPHARGDGPRRGPRAPSSGARSPRTWGWTEAGPSGAAAANAFPTHVGMDRRRRHLAGRQPRVPHARGDGPLPLRGGPIGLVRSPRTWGWTAQERRDRSGSGRSPRTWGWTVSSSLVAGVRIAFPTHVGMDRAGSPAPASR